MREITARDGTSIAYRRSGEGPPLVLVHGGLSDHTYWQPVLPTLEQLFTVYAMDRRGLGESGDSSDYAIEREFEDVAAVVDSVGELVNLLGHSHGGICSLEAAQLTPNVAKLVLYEPPLDVTGEGGLPPGFVEQLEAMLEEGDREGVIETFLLDALGMSPEEVEYLRSSPLAWQPMVASVHTLPREIQADQNYRFDPARFRDLTTPTLLLSGVDSPPFLKAGTQALNETLPASHVAVMSGQGHEAVGTGPGLFAAEVLKFLS
jgi:pimeloyl-ACP methyl ester carboxylesterase